MSSEPTADLAADRLEHNATFVGVLPALLVGVLVAVFVQPVVGVVLAVALGAAWVLVVRARIASAPERVTAGLVTTPLAPGSAPRLENLLEGLCVTSGVATPTVELVESPAVNALVTAGREHTRLVLTTGLVEHLGRLELEGVLANLLARAKDGSARYSTTVLALMGPSDRGVRLLERELGDQRGVRSDLAAVDLTRYPPGLIAALSNMQEHGTRVEAAPERSWPLWIAPVRTGDDDVLGALQPLSLRIAVLAEL